MKTLSLDGIEFLLDQRDGKDRAQSQDNHFVLVKSDEVIEYYENMKKAPPRTIMEVGVFEGGSLVYMDKLFKPEKIIGLDIRREPIPALDRYIEKNSHMKMYYARSQDKQGTLMAAHENFPNGIDLVVDDASHLYEQSKATFAMLFPLVKVGGEYILEDWAWSHRKRHQEPGAVWHDKTSLTTLVFELTVLASATSSIASVLVKNGLVSVRRGSGRPAKDAFDLAPYLRGRASPTL